MPEGGEAGSPPPNFNLVEAASGLRGSAGSGDLLVEQWDRKVRYFKLTSSDIVLLGGLGVLSTVFLSIGCGLIGFYINIEMSEAFATLPLSPEAKVYTEQIGPMVLKFGIGFAALGVLSACSGAVRFWFIKRDHVQRVANATL